MSREIEHRPTPIPNWPGYGATPDGRIWSLSANWRGYGQRVLAPHSDRDQYQSVRLTFAKGSRKKFKVHRLVAETFIGPRPSPRHEVRHLDGNRANNCASNLAWGTQKDNADDRERHGRTSRGARHSAAIRNSNQAEGTRAFRRAQREAAHG